jgi:hypothetical protein
VGSGSALHFSLPHLYSLGVLILFWNQFSVGSALPFLFLLHVHGVDMFWNLVSVSPESALLSFSSRTCSLEVLILFFSSLSVGSDLRAPFSSLHSHVPWGFDVFWNQFSVGRDLRSFPFLTCMFWF